METSSDLKDIFRQIEDHRSPVNQLHNLVNILLIDVISVIFGTETWEQMVKFAKSKEEFLNKFLELPNGIAPKHTINSVFSAIDSGQFTSCFVQQVNYIAYLSKGQIIAIDGKTLRGAKSSLFKFYDNLDPIEQFAAGGILQVFLNRYLMED